MVSQNEGPRRPKKPCKPNSDGFSREDLAKAESALNQEFMPQLRQAIELGRAGDLKLAAELSRKAIRAAEVKGGTTRLPLSWPSFLPCFQTLDLTRS